MPDDKKNIILKRIKKIFPFFALAVLTISLMFYFKANKSEFGQLVKESTGNLLDFYTENLKPILFETDITNDDIFNFALYQSLPVDKEQNRVIQIKDTEEGSFYEIKPASSDLSEKSYSNFKQYLNLNETESAKLDSILDSYREEIAEAVFVNDQKTVAINTRLADLQNALLSDIAAFLQGLNNTRANDILGTKYAFNQQAEQRNIVKDIKRDTTKQFIVITKDTVFASRLHFDSGLLAKQIDSVRYNLNKANKKYKQLVVKAVDANKYLPKPPVPERPIEFNIDTNSTFVFNPYSFEKKDFNRKQQKDYDSLKIVLDKVEKRLSNFSFNLNFDSLNSRIEMNLSGLSEDTLRNFNVKFDFEKLGNLINRSMKSINSAGKNEEYWEKFGRDMDSLAKEMVKVKGDTTLLDNSGLKKYIERKKKEASKKKR